MSGAVAEAPDTDSQVLIETHDTGRSQLDDTTRDDTPVIRFRLDDANLLYDLPGNTVADSPIDEAIRIPFNSDQTLDTATPGYRVAIFIEGEPQAAGRRATGTDRICPTYRCGRRRDSGRHLRVRLRLRRN